MTAKHINISLVLTFFVAKVIDIIYCEWRNEEANQSFCVWETKTRKSQYKAKNSNANANAMPESGTKYIVSVAYFLPSVIGPNYSFLT